MTTPVALRTLAARGVLAIGLSVLLTVSMLLTVDGFELVEPFGALTIPPVVFLTSLGVLAASAVYGALTRVLRHPDPAFTRLALVALLVSFLPSLIVLRFDEDATVGAVLVLMGMHVVVAIVCILVLTDRYSPIRPDRR